MTATSAHEPVAGDVVSRSTVKTIGGLILAVLMLLASLFLIWAWFTGFALPLPGGFVTITGLGAVVGVLGLLITPLIILYLGYMLVAQERMILGDDRLQIVRRQGGSDKVIGQIPYHNVARAEYGNDEGVRFLGIELLRADDPETFHSGIDFAREKKTYGWHFRILGGYHENVRTIHELLAGKLQRR